MFYVGVIKSPLTLNCGFFLNTTLSQSPCNSIFYGNYSKENPLQLSSPFSYVEPIERFQFSSLIRNVSMDIFTQITFTLC